MAMMAQILSALLLIPFVAWGVYTLRVRYRLREEYPLKVEAAMLGAVFVFYLIEVPLLNAWMAEQRALFLFAVLGLIVSGAALYGHMAVSVMSRLLVELMAPTEDHAPDRPRFGPAEALEREGDHEGALKEYMVLARIYPQYPAVYLRMTDVLLELERPHDAVLWLETGLRKVKDPKLGLSLATRVCELYVRQLNQPEASREILERFVEKHEGAPEVAVVRERLAAGEKDMCAMVSDALDALEDMPLDEGSAEDFVEAVEEEVEEIEGKRTPRIGLEAIDSPLQPEPEDDEPAPARNGRKRKSSIGGVERLSDSRLDEEDAG